MIRRSSISDTYCAEFAKTITNIEKQIIIGVPSNSLPNIPNLEAVLNELENFGFVRMPIPPCGMELGLTGLGYRLAYMLAENVGELSNDD